MINQLQLYSMAKIKPDAWKRFLQDERLDSNKPVPPPQVIVSMPVHTPFHEYVLLSFPLYWWHESDLEPYNNWNKNE